jgi:molecular chaperone DnaK
MTTARDGQRDLGLELFEGEGEGRRRLGRYTVANLPEARAGETLVWLEVRVDSDGLISVGARALGAEASMPVRMVAAVGLTRAEVRRLTAPPR